MYFSLSRALSVQSTLNVNVSYPVSQPKHVAYPSSHNQEHSEAIGHPQWGFSQASSSPGLAGQLERQCNPLALPCDVRTTRTEELWILVVEP